MRRIGHAGLSDAGRVRGTNEDRWAADRSLGLYVVADGLGGRAAGATAAQMAVDVLPALVRRRLEGVADLADPDAAESLAGALAELSARVHAATRRDAALHGMGAAVVVAVLRGAWGLLGHLGDCRAYLFRDGVLKRLTRDHSLVQLLLDSGDVTPTQAAAHPARGQLTRYLGMETEPLPEARVVALGAGDRLLLCSDGLTSQVGEEVIGDILGQARRRAEACERLVTAANAAGGRDNVTALILDVLD